MLAATYQPDVLLLDLVMPNMSGLELARQVRQKARLKDCFIIAVTGRTDAGYRLQCTEAGIDLFLIKPVTPAILKTLLVWEFEYVSRSRQLASKSQAISTRLPPQRDLNSQRPTRLACPIVQATVAS